MNGTLINYISPFLTAFGSIAVFAGVGIAGLRTIIHSRNPNERAGAMTSMMYVAIGSVILGSALIITGYLYNNSIELLNNVGSVGSVTTTPPDNNIVDSNGNFLTSAISSILNSFILSIQNIEGTVGFKPIDVLIFNRDMIGITSSSPFTESEWSTLNYLYRVIAGMTGVFFLIMVGKTGIEYIMYSGSASKRAELKEQVARWFYCIIAIATAPMLVQALFTVFNVLTGQLYNSISGNLPDLSLGGANGFLESIKTGSILTTAIVKCLFIYIELKLNIIFIARKIVLICLYAFTPIAAVLWGINNKVHASMIWFGEMLTNAVMQFMYAFVFFVMVAALGKSTWQQWFYSLMWMFSLISIAEMLRNSLQGIFTRMAGVDEASVGAGALGIVGKMFGGTRAAFQQSMTSGAGIMRNVYGQGTAYPSNKSGSTNTQTPSVNPPVASTAKGSLSSNGIIGGNTGSTPSGMPSVGGIESSKGSGIGSGTGQIDFGGNMYTPSKSGILMPMGVAADEEAASKLEPNNTEQSKEFAFDGRTVSPEDQKVYKQADDYNGILVNNLNRQMLSKDVGAVVGGVADLLIGHDPAFSTVARGIGNSVGGFQRKINAWKAISLTTDQMVEASNGNISKKEATQKLFNSSSRMQGAFRSLKFVNTVGSGNARNTEKLLAQWHPYTSGDGFKWKE